MNIRQFIKSVGATMTVAWADSNPNMIDPSPGMTHYTCKIKVRRRVMTVPFSMGSAHTKEPALADVLDCLASDANGIDGSFEHWCSDYGYDTDSRKAEHTYKTIQRQASKLKALLGDDAYETLLYKTERE